MAYSRKEVTDGITVMDKDLYDNLQDGIDSLLQALSDVSERVNNSGGVLIAPNGDQFKLGIDSSGLYVEPVATESNVVRTYLATVAQLNQATTEHYELEERFNEYVADEELPVEVKRVVTNEILVIE